LYYGLTHFSTAIFIKRGAPKAHAACCEIQQLLFVENFENLRLLANHRSGF